MTTARWGRIVWVTMLALAGTAGIGWTAEAPKRFNGIESTGRPRAADFTLTAHTGQRLRLSESSGKLRLLYFGYTHCPGICPTTLAEIDQALKNLPPRQAARVQVLMISVDPKRDTPKRMATYLAHFSPAFVGLTGRPEEIASVAAAYGIYYRVSDGPTPEEYVIDHTSMTIVVDGEGFVRVLFPFGTQQDKMAADLRGLLR